MLLKIKAKIYQYTGIYLARSEENAMMNTAEAITEIFMLTKLKYSPDQARGVVIGSWQAANGFASIGFRFWTPSNKKMHIKIYSSITTRFKIIYLQLKLDLGL